MELLGLARKVVVGEVLDEIPVLAIVEGLQGPLDVAVDGGQCLNFLE